MVYDGVMQREAESNENGMHIFFLAKEKKKNLT